MASAVIFVFPSEGAPADAECLRCISANGSPIKPRCRWVAMEVHGKMKQEQEPERLGGCCQQSLTTHLYRGSFFFLAFFWCSQPHAGHAGLSEGVEFRLPPQGALQSTSLFPKHSSLPHAVLPRPCSLSSPTLRTSVSPSHAKPGPCPCVSPELLWTPEHFLWPKAVLAPRSPMQWHRSTPHIFPPPCFTLGLGGSSGWHGGQGRGDGGADCGAGPLYHPQ